MTRRDLPGIALVASLGLLAFVLGKWLAGSSGYVSDVVIAIGLGAVLANTALGRRLGIVNSAVRDSNRYEAGLRFTGKWLLRAAIILMGLKFELNVFQPEQVIACGLVLAFSMPTAYFIAQFVAGRLRLRRELGDLISIGTMICGASAINALAPVVAARRSDQALAITSVFLFSVTALLIFHPIGQALGLADTTAGLWSGLAVNDLAGSVAVGTQFSSAAGLIATASKSLRITLLGPVLLLFSFLYRLRSAKVETGTKTPFFQHFPQFILGYLALCAVRYGGDAFFGTASGWVGLLWVNGVVVKLLVLTVGAGIGLTIDVRTIVQVGWRAAIASGAASTAMASVTLAMVIALARGATGTAAAIGASVATASAGLFAFGRWLEPEAVRLLRRMNQGATLSMREAAELLVMHEAEGKLEPKLFEQILTQLHPAIGELQPLREAPIHKPYAYRRMTWWKSSRGEGELVAMLWLPGASTHIHSHDCTAIGRNMEGAVEVLDFERDGDQLTVSGRIKLEGGALLRIEDPARAHMVRNVLDRDAIDVHVYMGKPSCTSLRFDPTVACDVGALAIGTKLEVKVTPDVHPPTLMVPMRQVG